MTQALTIPGPAGSLEAVMDGPGDAGRAAILCHPHPQYGGSLYDAVLETVAGELTAAGFKVLRFNFRGVGASDGAWDNGVGECDDLLAVVAHVRELGLAISVVGGYSFGAAIAARTVTAVAPERLILVAPPMAMLGDLALPAGTTVIVGDQDPYTSADELATAHTGINLTAVAGADHFFSGCHAQLLAAAREFAHGA